MRGSVGTILRIVETKCRVVQGLVEPEKPEASGLTKRGHERAMLCFLSSL